MCVCVGVVVTQNSKENEIKENKKREEVQRYEFKKEQLMYERDQYKAMVSRYPDKAYDLKNRIVRINIKINLIDKNIQDIKEGKPAYYPYVD